MNVETRSGGGPAGEAHGPGAGLEVDGSLAVHDAERALEGRAPTAGILEVCLRRRGNRPVFQVLVQQPAGPARAEVDAATGRILDLSLGTGGPIAGPAANDPSHG